MNDAVNYIEALNHFPHAHTSQESKSSRPKGLIRSVPEDFNVQELLGFDLSGDGPHAWLHIRKKLLNTMDVVQTLSKRYGLAVRDVGYSGLKDRNAVTKQWVSLPMELTSRVPVMNDFSMEEDNFEIIEMEYHQKKLKRGAHRANYFEIIVRFQDVIEGIYATTETLLQSMKSKGVPNYFGEQRFGRNANNLTSAENYFNGTLNKPTRQLKSFMLSAARSWLFNLVLSKRVDDASWNKAMKGDAIQFDSSGSFFYYDGTDSTVGERVEENICHPTGPLWGAGDIPVGDAVQTLEEECLETMASFRAGLEKNGLKHQRRALRVALADLNWQWLLVDDDGYLHNAAENENMNAIALSFTLPSGCFATSVLRELVDTTV